MRPRRAQIAHRSNAATVGGFVNSMRGNGTSGLTIVESDKASGTIKSEARAGMTTSGEVLGLYARPTTAGAETYTVEVESKKRSELQIAGQNYQPSVLANIKTELGM